MELGKKGNITDQVMKDKANSEKAKIQELSIYDQALAKYNTDIKDEDIKAAVEDIIANKVAENDTVEVKKRQCAQKCSNHQKYLFYKSF